MKLAKSLSRAFGIVAHSKLRSWLTIIGVVIGVASVIAIVSMGKGMQASVEEGLGGLGADLITITPGASRGFGRGPFRMETGAVEEEVTLDDKDVLALKLIVGIDEISPEISGNVEVSYLSKFAKVNIRGIDPSVWPKVTTEEVVGGRMFGPADRNVVLIGSRLAEDYFDSPVGLNQRIQVEGGSYRVVGILDGGSTVYMPMQSAYSLLDDVERGTYGSIVVKIREGGDLDAVREEIERRLRISRNVSEKEQDFSVSDPSAFSERISEVSTTMTTFLAGIAAISLVVGSVGIANTMFTSVLERTKDIGIMKAIGARNRDVFTIFIFSSALLSLFGGIIGVALGIWLSTLVGPVMGTGVQGVVTPDVVAGSLSISVVVGLVSGFAPAYKASKLKPAEALRWG